MNFAADAERWANRDAAIARSAGRAGLGRWTSRSSARWETSRPLPPVERPG